VVIAIVASWGAMLIMYRQDWLKLSAFPRTVLGALVMGLAISSMHYTAMLGMDIPEGGMCLTDALRIEPNIMAAMLTMTALVWFGGGLLASLFDQRMARTAS
jgi:NO-binding membrane sensor protein with MHYT domain